MATTNNEVLGYRICDTCGDRATVHQAKGRRNQLYQRSCSCGCVQSNGALVQSKLWHETQWLDGMKPARPPVNVLELQTYRSALTKESERLKTRLAGASENPGQVDREARENTGLEPDENPGQQTDFNPESDQDVNQDADREIQVKKPIGLWWLIAAAGIVTAIVAG